MIFNILIMAYFFLGPVLLTVLWSHFIEILPYCNSITGHQITTKFCTCHNSRVVMPGAKFCNDYLVIIWMRIKWNSHHIWIVMEKMLVKWATDPYCTPSFSWWSKWWYIKIGWYFMTWCHQATSMTSKYVNPDIWCHIVLWFMIQTMLAHVWDSHIW